ncbi:DUF1115-domain-containing protein [Rhizophagus irregularis]|uniref:DUF1115-domain-containing protein n=1 Tax=Rhizophagus irregularis TaxID=588596 RepID=A0A2N0PJX9_9GLOM|nr:DUF1115-domain-containing protein [Rhizophagus irregularis]
MDSSRQLQCEELSLLIAMFVDNEFQWIGDENQIESWKSIIDNFNLNQTTIRNLEEIPQFRFRLSLDINNSWLNVFLPLRYPKVQPECYFSSDNVNKQTWTEINFEIEMKVKELNANGECCIFELYQHTKSYLTEKFSQYTLSDYDDNKNEKEKASLQLSRILIWTHHLLSLEKRKNICQWAEELGLWGFSKPGYPGIIIVEGLNDRVHEYISRLKSLRWQAITVRSEQTEPLDLKEQHYGERVKLRLGRSNPGVTELETMSEISSKMKKADLEEMFMSAMKINKK